MSKKEMRNKKIKENWEKEFKMKFANWIMCDEAVLFIRQLLSKSRQEFADELIKKLVKMGEKETQETHNFLGDKRWSKQQKDDASVWLGGFSQALFDILEIIKKQKKK